VADCYLQVVWAEDAYAVNVSAVLLLQMHITTGVPSETLITILHLPSHRAILSSYQFSAEMVFPSHVVIALSVKGHKNFLDLG